MSTNKETKTIKRIEKIIFKIWLVLNDKTFKDVAKETGISQNAINKMLNCQNIVGVFAEWWNTHMTELQKDFIEPCTNEDFYNKKCVKKYYKKLWNKWALAN